MQRSDHRHSYKVLGLILCVGILFLIAWGWLSQKTADWNRRAEAMLLLERLDAQVRFNSDDELEDLGLYGPAVNDKVIASLDLFPKLRELRLSQSAITDRGLEKLLDALPQLQLLYLDGTRISDTALASVARLPRLERLNLARTDVTDEGLQQLRSMTGLQELILAETAVTDDALKTVGSLTSLRELILAHTSVGDPGLAHLVGLRGLASLDLYGTRVTDVGLASLSGLVNLRRLSLKRTAVTDAGLVHLQGLTALAILDVSETGVTPDGAEDLTEKLPGPDPFAAQVRPTDPLSPAEEQKAFHLPPGFEVQLFASEPEILKPMNMAFDAKGRLWITESQEYPYAAPMDRAGRDHVKILEDTNGDGRADKITTFADGLNIPIGLYPYRDGCVVFSIPHVWFLRDTNGDGRCDVREKLFGPMGYDRDTHGLNNAFRRGFDGWLYACHGFNNQTEVAGTDGQEITMQSGNTYRMRLDGSRVEHFTHGQTNPFGMTFDEWGNSFTADCHSKPLTQLLRGAYYPSFGKPHDGLGFVSPMMDHTHGSTAIAGVAYYTGENFPEAYRNNLYSGNVMTSCINRNSLEFHGSTIRAKEQPDFLECDDPWFRPVDVQLGPDGALYVADFYNRIIGHWEVPLDHPGRDRHRGRIWRIVYTGNDPNTKPPEKVDLSQATTKALIQALADPNLTVRQLAADQLSDRVGLDAVPQLELALGTSESPQAKVHAFWVLYRLDRLNEDLLAKAAEDESPLLRTQAMKALAETANWSPQLIALARGGLSDFNAFVQRAAADAFGQHPDVSAISDLLAMLPKVPAEDDHLRHVVRMAIRNQLRRPEAFAELQLQELSPRDRRDLLDLALAVESEASASFVLDRIVAENLPTELLTRALEHAVRFLPANKTDQLVKVAREKCGEDWDLQFRLLTALHAGLERRGVKPTDTVREWVAEVTQQWLADLPPQALAWANTPLASEANQANPWAVQQWASVDGDRVSWFFCSWPHGEQLTGRLRSRDFEIPERFSFYVAGHLGPPNQPAQAKNFVRLLEAKSNAVLREITPPRNDVAHQVEWDLQEFAGKQGYLEIVDGDSGGAYAWLAVGRLEPPLVPIPSLSPRVAEERLITTANLVSQYEITETQPVFARLLKQEPLAPRVSAALIRAVGSLSHRPEISPLALVAEDPAIPHLLRHQLCKAVASSGSEEIQAATTEAFRQSPARLQTALGDALASDEKGRELVLDLIEKGIAPARMLLNPPLKNRLLSMAKTAAEQQSLEQRLARLTASLPAADESIEQLLQARLQGFQKAKPDSDQGLASFKKHCAACHQVDGNGSLVGPQLDGIGNRGLERLLEDVLDPNRNVDVAFRLSTFALDDGTIHTGLLRRDEGAVRVLVDQKGQEFTIRREDIAEERKSNLSLMPANVAEIIPENEFYDLIAFLLSRRTPTEREAPMTNFRDQRSGARSQ